MSKVEVKRGKLPPRQAKGRPYKWPFATMKAGHYFIVKDGTTSSSIRSSIFHAQKKLKRRFATRLIEGQLHVWRTK